MISANTITANTITANTITANTITANTITVKMWKDISEFDPLKDGNFDCDGTVKRIAMITGKSVEEIESMPMADLLPAFLDCVKTVNKEVFSKMEKLKNVDGVRE